MAPPGASRFAGLRRGSRAVLRGSLDLRLPPHLFPAARALPRTVHAHLGPTNSGKTHAAIAALADAGSGVYCAPLRLLAHEIRERLMGSGVACDLLTGQERVTLDGACHTACTIEMAPVGQGVEVAVLDEIQMISDDTRGWAWTRALLGIRAPHIHVCGSADSLDLLRKLVASCGDTLVEHAYERLSPLRVSSRSLRSDLSLIQPGDCVVAFSRRELFQLRQRIESATGHAGALVYGALPPEVRRDQAEQFNSRTGGPSVMLATDAIGMGLNLQIRRVVFAAMHKFDGTSVRPLSPSEVKQVAGRAGRFDSRWTGGEVTCLHAGDQHSLAQAIAAASPPLTKAGLQPTVDQLANFERATESRQLFSQLLAAFEESARVDPHYFCCSLETMQQLAQLVDRVKGLSLQQRYVLCQATKFAIACQSQ